MKAPYEENIVKCPNCNGLGHIKNMSICPICHGDGEVDTDDVEYKIWCKEEYSENSW